jgi:hypothetical protein
MRGRRCQGDSREQMSLPGKSAAGCWAGRHDIESLDAHDGPEADRSMAMDESTQRMERRRLQQWLDAWRPGMRALWRQMEQRQRYLRRHPFSGAAPEVLRAHCRWNGMLYGGRAPSHRRCRKRLKTRFCRNWSVDGTDRCHRHRRIHTEAIPNTKKCSGCREHLQASPPIKNCQITVSGAAPPTNKQTVK